MNKIKKLCKKISGQIKDIDRGSGPYTVKELLHDLESLKLKDSDIVMIGKLGSNAGYSLLRLEKRQGDILLSPNSEPIKYKGEL